MEIVIHKERWKHKKWKEIRLTVSFEWDIGTLLFLLLTDRLGISLTITRRRCRRWWWCPTRCWWTCLWARNNRWCWWWAVWPDWWILKKFWWQIFLLTWPKYLVTIWPFWKLHFVSKNWWGYFLVTFWWYWATLKSNIWSHWWWGWRWGSSDSVCCMMRRSARQLIKWQVKYKSKRTYLNKKYFIPTFVKFVYNFVTP